MTVEGQGPLDAASGGVKYRIQHIFEIGDTAACSDPGTPACSHPLRTPPDTPGAGGRDTPSVRGIWANLAVSLALRACPLYHTLAPAPGPSAASTQASGGKGVVPAEDLERVKPGGDAAFPTDAGCAHGVNGGRCVCVCVLAHCCNSSNAHCINDLGVMSHVSCSSESCVM